MFSKESILEFLDKATDAAKAIAPTASSFGIPFVEKVTAWADTAVDIVKNSIERAEEAKIVLTSDDEAEINAKIAALDAVNNELAEYVRNS